MCNDVSHSRRCTAKLPKRCVARKSERFTKLLVALDQLKALRKTQTLDPSDVCAMCLPISINFFDLGLIDRTQH